MKFKLKRISVSFLCVIGLFFSTIIINAQSSIEVREGTSYSSTQFTSETIDGVLTSIWKLKVNKTNPEKLSISMITHTDDKSVWQFFNDKFKIVNYVKLDSIPTVESTGNYVYIIEYSLDGVNYSDVAPSDLSLVTAFRVRFPNPVAKSTKITISFDLVPILSSIPDTSGLAIERTYDVDYGSWGPYYDRKLNSFYVASMTDPAEVLTIKYVDENNNPISPDKTLQGIIGDLYDLNDPNYLIDIPGYRLNTEQLPANLKGMLTSNQQTVTIPYTKRLPQPVVVEYVDEMGNSLAPTETITGDYNDPYISQAKAIYGWKLKTMPTNAQGIITDVLQTVTYVYTRQEAGNVTVLYVDEVGNELAPSETITGYVGDSYTTNAKVINGWQLRETPLNAKGNLSDVAQTVTYVYRNDSLTDPENGGGNSEGPQTLPETGLKQHSNLLPFWLVMIGLFMLFTKNPKIQRRNH